MALAAVVNMLGAPAAICSAAAAPLNYLLPLGVGLLLIQGIAGVTRTQRLLAAYLVGLIAICAVLVAREQWMPARLSIDVCAGVIGATALVGFATTGPLFRWDPAARAATLEFVVVLPVFAIGYALRFGVFSEYPTTDLFQATHLMKGALDFGRFDMLNPFTADSYPPVVPVMEGLLFRYFGFEPLHGFWLVSALSVAPKFLALRAAVQPLFGSSVPRTLAIAAAASFVSVVAPTNGELAMFGALLVFALLLSAVLDQPPKRQLLYTAVLAAACALAYLSSRATPFLYLAALGLACFMPGRVTMRSRLPPAILGAVPLVVTVAPLHRSAVLFLPLALLCGLSLSLLRYWSHRGDANGRLLAGAAGVLTALAALAILTLLVWLLTHPTEDLRSLEAYRWLVETILGTTLAGNPEVLFGTGPKVALFELARAMSSSFVLSAFGLAMYAWLRGASRAAPCTPEVAAVAGHAVAAWVIAVAVGCGMLLGVPFAYRGGFFIVVLLAIALGAGFSVLLDVDKGGRVQLVLVGATAAYALVIIPLAYGCWPFLSCARAAYSEMARPFLAVLSIAVLALALAAWLARAHERRLRAIAAITLVLVFALEFAMSKTHFFPYAYGSPPPSGQPVSHLSYAEIELAGSLRSVGGNAVLISDPFTMANLRGLTGLNSLITFSNLDTLSSHSAKRLRSWLRSVLDGDASGRCSATSPLAVLGGPVNSAEFNYWLARVAQPERHGAEILEDFGFRRSFVLAADFSSSRSLTAAPVDHEWHRRALEQSARRGLGPEFVLVVNRKTVAWTYEEPVGYFPNIDELDPELIDSLRQRCQARLHGRRFLLVNLSAKEP